jgi:hypothetical protein
MKFALFALDHASETECDGEAGHGDLLGDGSIDQRLTPVEVSRLASGVSAISADNFHTCAVTTSGGAKCWGDNRDGQLGDGTTTPQLTPTNEPPRDSWRLWCAPGLVESRSWTLMLLS